MNRVVNTSGKAAGHFAADLNMEHQVKNFEILGRQYWVKQER
jgi:hypothetical protein